MHYALQLLSLHSKQEIYMIQYCVQCLSIVVDSQTIIGQTSRVNKLCMLVKMYLLSTDFIQVQIIQPSFFGVQNIPATEL